MQPPYTTELSVYLGLMPALLRSQNSQRILANSSRQVASGPAGNCFILSNPDKVAYVAE